MKGLLKGCILFIFLLLGYSAGSQTFSTSYTPVRNYRPTKEYLKMVYAGFDSIYNNTNYSGRGERKVVKEAIKDSKEYLMSLDTAEALMRGDTLTQYLQAITNKIMDRNKGFVQGRKFKVFTYRSGVPNAFSMGNGVILFTLDFLSKLNNEEEVAYILSHEMSHDIMNHVMNSLQKRYEIINSKEFKADVKKIKKQEFGQFKAIEALYAKYLYRYTKGSRVNELEADSLGLILFHNAGYSASVALATEASLDSIDNAVFRSKIDFTRFFDFPSTPFKKSWLELEEEESIGGNIKDEEFPDSLKTHPDCKNRVKALERIIARNHYDLKKSVIPMNPTDHYRIKACFEILEYRLSEYDLSAALHINLQLLRLYPNNDYLKCSLVNCLFELYRAKEDHYYSMVGDYPDKKMYCVSYNELTTFLQNVNSETLKNIMFNYYYTHVQGKINNSYSGYLEVLIKSINTPKPEREKLPAQYKAKHSDVYYFMLLAARFKPIKK